MGCKHCKCRINPLHHNTNRCPVILNIYSSSFLFDIFIFCLFARQTDRQRSHQPVHISTNHSGTKLGLGTQPGSLTWNHHACMTGNPELKPGIQCTLSTLKPGCRNPQWRLNHKGNFSTARNTYFHVRGRPKTGSFLLLPLACSAATPVTCRNKIQCILMTPSPCNFTFNGVCEYSKPSFTYQNLEKQEEAGVHSTCKQLFPDLLSVEDWEWLTPTDWLARPCDAFLVGSSFFGCCQSRGVKL